MMKKTILSILIAALTLPLIAGAAATTWDFANSVLQPLQSMWSAQIKGAYFTATSTTKSTFPYASSTALSVSGSLYTPLTATRIPYIGTGGLLTDNASLTTTGTTLTVGTGGTLVTIGADSITGGADTVLNITTGSGFIGYGGSNSATYPHEFTGQAWFDSQVVLQSGISGDGSSLTNIPASAITSGTFGSGNYVFPAGLTVTNNLTANSATTTGSLGVGTFLELAEQASNPATPGANKGIIFVKDDGFGSSVPFFRSDDGIVSQLAGGSGGGCSDLDCLDDVALTSTAWGNLLRYDGTNFVNVATSTLGLPTFGGTNTWTGANTFSGGVTLGNATSTSFAITNTLSKILKTDAAGSISGAVAGTDYENPLTFDTSYFTRNTNTVTQNLAMTPTWTGLHTFNTLPESDGDTPTTDNQFVTFGYVSGLGTSQLYKDAVAAATTTNLTLSGVQDVDAGVTGASGQRVLAASQTTVANSGCYTQAAGAWTRCTDYDTAGEVLLGTSFPVAGGTANDGAIFIMNSPSVVTLGSDPITFSKYNPPSVTCTVPLICAGSNVSLGTVTTANGGTGLTSWTQGDIPFYTSGTALSKLAKNTSATRYLSNTGTDNAPAWAQIDLSNGVTGDLPFANLTQGSALSVLGVTGNSTADVASIAAGTDHQVLRRSGTSLAFGSINLASTDAVTGILAVANGGSGSASPSLVAGSGISIAGTWPNQTITNTGGGGGGGGGSGSTVVATTTRKIVDETVTSATTGATLQDDDELKFHMGANETWTARFSLVVRAHGQPDIKLAVNAPTGASCTSRVVDPVGNFIGNTETCDTAISFQTNNGDQGAEVIATFVNGATPGNAVLRWAQNSNKADDTTVRAGSYVQAMSTTTAAGTAPGGSNTQVQFNDSGSFGGDSAFVWNKTSNFLGLGVTPDVALDISVDNADADSIIAQEIAVAVSDSCVACFDGTALKLTVDAAGGDPNSGYGINANFTASAGAFAADTYALFNTGGMWNVAGSGKVGAGLGAVGAPSFSIFTDQNTGMWSSGADTLNFSTGGAERLRIDSSGLVGIGTTPGAARLHVVDNANNYLAYFRQTAGAGDMFLGFQASSGDIWRLQTRTDSSLNFYNATDAAWRFTIGNTGRVGIATTSPWATLSVEMDTDDAFVVNNAGSTTPSLIVKGVNGNGHVGIGDATPIATLAVGNSAATALSSTTPVFISEAVDGEFMAAYFVNDEQAAGGSTNEQTSLGLGWRGGGTTSGHGAKITAGKESSYIDTASSDSFMSFFVHENNELKETLKLTSAGAVKMERISNSETGTALCYDTTNKTVHFSLFGDCNSVASPFWTMYKDGKKIEDIEFSANLNTKAKEDWQTFDLKNWNHGNYEIIINNRKEETDYIDAVQVILYGSREDKKSGTLEYYRLDTSIKDINKKDGKYLILEQGETRKVTLEDIPDDFVVHSAVLKTYGYYLPYVDGQPQPRTEGSIINKIIRWFK